MGETSGESTEESTGETAAATLWLKLAKVLFRLGALRTVPGFRVDVRKGSELRLRSVCCDVCGEPGEHEWGPSSRVGLLGRSMPALRVFLCAKCHVQMWSRLVWCLSTAVLGAVASVGFAWIVQAIWPWAPWVAVVGISIVGVVLAFFVALVLPGRVLRGELAWQGNPARVVQIGDDGFTVEVVSSQLALGFQNQGISVCSCDVVESDVVPVVFGGVIGVLLVGAVLWWPWHPEVRVVNVTEQPLEILVDGRAVALVPGLPVEVAGAGESVRIPRGWRVLRARALDGRVVDEVYRAVGLGKSQLFVPGSNGICFWVERRAYGRAEKPRPEIVVLPHNERFHTLFESVDAWFEPNPTVEPGSWFTGGVRRAVRRGECR